MPLFQDGKPGAGAQAPALRWQDRFATDVRKGTLYLDERAGLGEIGEIHLVALRRLGPLYVTIRVPEAQLRKIMALRAKQEAVSRNGMGASEEPTPPVIGPDGQLVPPVADKWVQSGPTAKGTLSTGTVFTYRPMCRLSVWNASHPRNMRGNAVGKAGGSKRSAYSGPPNRSSGTERPIKQLRQSGMPMAHWWPI